MNSGWIPPGVSKYSPCAEMTTDIRNGQLLRGHAAPYFPNNTERFGHTFDGAPQAIGGCGLGDIPALRWRPPNMDGLAIIAH